MNHNELRVLVDAGNRLDSAMDMQEQRERGTFHLSQQAAAGVWKNARRLWAEAVEQALSATMLATAPAAPVAVELTRCCGREECGGECGNDWRGTEWVRKSAPAVEVDEAMELRLCETKFKVEPLFEHPKAPVGAQPVAWACTDYDGHVGVGLTKEEAKRQAGESCNEYFPLYTTPPQPQDAVRDREDVRS